MDSGWAVVIGAAIALVGSIAAPWAREYFERKHRAEAERRAAIARALLTLTEGATTLCTAKIFATTMASPKHQRELMRALAVMQTANAELAYQLRPSESDIQRLAVAMYTSDLRDDTVPPVLDFTLITARWLRNEIDAPQAAREFFAKHPKSVK